MRRVPLLPPAVRKEVGALLPMWIACMVALVAAAVTREGIVIAAATAAYAVGSIALGAHAIGHEYSHRTLAILLSQPVERRRLYLTKMGITAVLLAALAAAAWVLLFDTPFLNSRADADWRLAALAPLGGLFLAPWLTMVARTQIGGVVFTVGIAGTMMVASETAVAWLYPDSGAERNALLMMFWSRGMFVLCTAGAALGWWSFMRLQATDGAGRAIGLPAALRRSRVVRVRHPLWVLAKKELHLQHLTLVITVGYILVWGALVLGKQVFPALRQFPLGAITSLYLMLLAILIGSLASAEERQFGTLESQMLLPMAAWQQWIVKVAVAGGLAVLLGVAVPVLLGVNDVAWPPEVSLVVAVLTIASLYVSSLSSSGVRALALAFPAGFVAVLFLRTVDWLWYQLPLPRASLLELAGLSLRSGWFVMGPGLIVLLAAFGFANHRSAERSTRRVCVQVGWIAAYLAVAVLAM